METKGKKKGRPKATRKSIPNKEIGARIRVARKERGLTQMQLADKVGVSFQQIQKYETGKDRIFVERLQQIAKALDVPMAYFFEEYGDKDFSSKLVPKEVKELLPLSKEEVVIVRKLRAMGEKLRKNFLNQLETISEMVSGAKKT